MLVFVVLGIIVVCMPFVIFSDWKYSWVLYVLGMVFLLIILANGIKEYNEKQEVFKSHKQQCIKLYRPDYKKMNECIKFYEAVDHD